MIGKFAKNLTILRLHAPVDGSILPINDNLVKSAQVISAKDDRDDFEALADAQNWPGFPMHVLLKQTVVEDLLCSLVVRMLLFIIDQL